MITIPEGWYLAAMDYATPYVAKASDGIAGRWFFFVRDGVDFRTAVVESVHAWAAALRRELADGEQIELPKNWGDWANECSPEILEALGLRFVNIPWTKQVLVDHDESIVDDDGNVPVLDELQYWS